MKKVIESIVSLRRMSSLLYLPSVSPLVRQFPPHQNLCHFHSFDSIGAKALLSKGQLHEGNLHIFLRGILGSDLEDDVLLVLGNGLLADGFDEFAQPSNIMLAIVTASRLARNLLERQPVLVLGSRVEAGI